MAGKPGRSGGARPGAGRKPAPKTPSTNERLRTDDPVAWLTACMQDESLDVKDRKDAAKALLILHNKREQAGKKGLRSEAAEKASTGRFAPAAAPKLLLVKK